MHTGDLNSIEGAGHFGTIRILGSVWSVLQEKVYRSKIADIDELKTRLVNEWAQFDQSIIDAAISQWRRRLSACVRARGAHFEHKF